MGVDINQVLKSGGGLSGNGLGMAATPSTVSLDAASLNMLSSGQNQGVAGEVHHHYHLNTETSRSQGDVLDSFKLLEMLGA